MLFAFVACTPAASDSAAVVEVDPCANGPKITITAPEHEATFTVGETIEFTAEATSEVDPAEGLLILWSIAIGSDEVKDGKGTSMSFTPDVAENYNVIAQVEDSCEKAVQDSIRFEVVAP